MPPPSGRPLRLLAAGAPPELTTAPPATLRPSHPAWLDWQAQLRARITTAEALAAWIHLTPAEHQGIAAGAPLFRFALTPYTASLMDPEDPTCPIRMQYVPDALEARIQAGELADPLGEDHLMPVPGLVHRYPDRALLIGLDTCATYCRHCTRRRLTGREESLLRADFLDQAIAYLQAHTEIRDILLSGGDPLLMATPKLDHVLTKLRSVPHLEIIRIGTRVPVQLPMRVDDALACMLRRHAPLFVNTQFNHPKELTPLARQACATLIDRGIPVGNQTVLLRRINSSAPTLKKLFTELLRTRIKPHYLFQTDVAHGIEHFRTPIAKGIEIIEHLRGHMTGFGIPEFAVDLPGGGGKVTVQPNYLLTPGEHATLFRNYEGKLYRYPEPAQRDCSVPYEATYFASEPSPLPSGGAAAVLASISPPVGPISACAE